MAATDPLCKLEGQITGLVRRRQNRDFVLGVMGGDVDASAVAASLAGMGGAAMAIASLDSRETADFVEFSLDGVPVRGWFWRFPFAEGERIELVAERDAHGWMALGARRKHDGLVAVYPHCFEGRRAHYVSTFRFWGLVVAVIFLFMMALDAVFALFRGTFSVADQGAAYAVYGAYGLPALVAVFGFLAWRAGRKTEGLARTAERIFAGFGWEDPAGINLRKTSRALRREGDGRDYGLRVFRY
ncbi:hypothetical protein LMG3458_05973 [Achromobacter deleyi]|uniref:Uncharacterized protein n=1 Tax=Achromobacter deleyi TaxID=1353891 RepID=A0A6S7APN9_9BURK|nr:putative type VI secretion system effector [Achromobacter deleyi]CAB3742599.1 hypothetical protein LMG3458_05973 [Achromobacter deleyi]CAB3921955.1 hypothetical protein LMG3481_05433 [Achromobacter deleyi]CAB3924662.1 hypothetical protein LMG3412_05641 [Achromobacter deleyi]CAB3926844.1 hypothetical protein LMG3482_06026 [Achromobacter deleyi]